MDGKTDVDDRYLESQGIRMMPEFVEPYHERRHLTKGEIGCFMSHYNVWLDVIEKGYDKVVVFEDDIRFEPYFRAKVDHLQHTELASLDWDLVFLGRKILWDVEEPWVQGSQVGLRFCAHPSQIYA